MDMRSTILRSTLVFSLASVSAFTYAEGIYVLASGGKSHFSTNVDRNDLDADNEDKTGMDIISSKLDHEDTAYKIQLGYQFNENFSIEGGYVDLGSAEYKADIESPNGLTTGASKAKFEAKGWNLDALLTLPINAGFSLFLKAGAIRAEVEASTAVASTGPGAVNNSASSSQNKITPNVGLGVGYNFYKGLTARIEVERFSNLRSDDVNGFDVKSSVDLYSVGLAYQF